MAAFLPVKTGHWEKKPSVAKCCWNWIYHCRSHMFDSFSWEKSEKIGPSAIEQFWGLFFQSLGEKRFHKNPGQFFCFNVVSHLGVSHERNSRLFGWGFQFWAFRGFSPSFNPVTGRKGISWGKILHAMFCACNLFRRQIYINFPIFQVGCTTFLGFWGFSSSEWFKRVQNGHLGAISGSSGTELVEQCGTTNKGGASKGTLRAM